jgi:hypothetical protein
VVIFRRDFLRVLGIFRLFYNLFYLHILGQFQGLYWLIFIGFFLFIVFLIDDIIIDLGVLCLFFKEKFMRIHLDRKYFGSIFEPIM